MRFKNKIWVKPFSCTSIKIEMQLKLFQKPTLITNIFLILCPNEMILNSF